MIRGYVSSDEDDYDDFDFGYSETLTPERKSSFSLPEIQTKEVKEQLLSALEESEKIQHFLKAVDDCDLTTLEHLISLGVSPDSADLQGWTSLMKACGVGNVDVVHFLLEHGANPNKHRELFTPLMTCCTYTLIAEDSKLNCARLLVQYGADVNAKDKYRTTALMYACGSGYRDIVAELLRAPGIDVNLQDKEGWSAPFYAVNRNDINLVEKLMSAKIDLSLKDKYDRTVVNLALDKDFRNIAEVLGYVEETLPEPEKKIEPRDRFLKELPDSNGQGGFATDAEEILHAFDQYNVKSISLFDLLNATEKDLYEIGVKLLPDRQKILCKGIHRYHLQPWRSSSMHQITRGVSMSLEDAIAITGALARHLTIANASLKYLDTRIYSRQNKEPVDLAVERETIIFLINTYNSAEKLKMLLPEIIKRIAKIKREVPADYIYPFEKEKQGRFLKFFSYGVGAVIAGFFICYHKPNSHFKKLIRFLFYPFVSFFPLFQPEPFQNFFDEYYQNVRY